MADSYDYDLDEVSFITVGTQGPPGQRTFYLQASRSQQVISLVIEKEQATALASGIHRLLAALGSGEEEGPGEPEAGDTRMNLLQPVNEEFRVAEMGLGVDEERDLIVLVAHESPSDEPGRRARFTATVEQMQALAAHAAHVAEQGRPTCPLCGRPMDPDGHFCPRSNGHATHDD